MIILFNDTFSVHLRDDFGYEYFRTFKDKDFETAVRWFKDIKKRNERKHLAAQIALNITPFSVSQKSQSKKS